MAGETALGTVAADSAVARRGLTREQYDVLVEAGLLEGEPVELLEGVLTEVVPQGSEHSRLLAKLSWWLSRSLDEPWRVMVQSPLAVSPTSEPEPDLAVVHREPGADGCADVARMPWTERLWVPVASPVPVVLSELLAP